MAKYIKVTEQVAVALGVDLADKNQTADGNRLLWQADLNGVPGDTLLEKVTAIGGVALSPQEAKVETDGCDNPAVVYTPDAYQPAAESEDAEINDEDEGSEDTETTNEDEESEGTEINNEEEE